MNGFGPAGKQGELDERLDESEVTRTGSDHHPEAMTRPASQCLQRSHSIGSGPEFKPMESTDPHAPCQPPQHPRLRPWSSTDQPYLNLIESLHLPGFVSEAAVLLAP